MNKPYFEVHGHYKFPETDDYDKFFDCFKTHKDALEFCEENLREYVIYMKMKIEEKKK